MNPQDHVQAGQIRTQAEAGKLASKTSWGAPGLTRDSGSGKQKMNRKILGQLGPTYMCPCTPARL